MIEVAGVTRATFYRHFPSKDDLVVSYLRAVHEAVRDIAGEEPGEPRLRRVVGSMGETLCAPGFRGCSFINAAAEFADPGSPVHRAVADYRDWLTGVFVADLAATGHGDPAGWAWQTATLLDLR